MQQDYQKKKKKNDLKKMNVDIATHEFIFVYGPRDERGGPFSFFLILVSHGLLSCS